MEQNPTLGPFTKQTFDQEFWKKILDSLLQLRYDFQKPIFLPEYKYLLQLIQEINSSPHYDKYFGLPSIKDYFLNQFLPSAIISLIDCKSAVDNEVIEFIDECLCQLIDLCLRTLKEGLFGPARILDLILKPTRPYYQSIRSFSSCKKSSEEHDSNDVNENRVLFTEIRPENDPSAFIWDLINKFGAGGGFELIYDTIYDTPILPQNVSILCSMVANICPILNKGFVQEYVPKLEEAVLANWFSHPYVNLTYQVAEAMTEAFKILLARIYPSLELANMIARFKLKLCARYFEFSSSESLTQGLGSLTSIIKENDNLEFLREFIKENNVFREIYVPQGYPALIKRSVQFMQHLLKKNWIGSEELDVLWDCIINGKPDVVSELYNLLHCCGQSLQDSHADYLLSKIIELPIEEITEKKMEVAIVIAKIKIMTSSYPFWELFWKVASPNQKSKAAMPLYYTDTFQRFYRYIVIRHLEYKDEILSAINEFLECIDRKESVLISLGRIKMMITHFNETSVSKTGFTRSMCINHLCKKYNMIRRILNELKSFKSELLKKIPNKNDLADKALNDELVQIYERLDCIKYILNNYEGNEEILDDEMLYDIWDMTIANAIAEGERKYGFNFLGELVDLIYNSPLISLDNLLRFFQRKLNYKELQDCQSLNETAFVCFNKFFLVINLNLGNLSGLFRLSSNKHSSSSSAAKKETDTRKTEPLDHKVNVSPDQLEGIEELWKFWMEDCGFYSLADTLINIYMHPNIIPKRQEFLDRCFKRLKKELENNSQNKTRRNTLTRYFTLIADAIEEAELEGHGDLKSHSELVLGELLNLRLHFNNAHMPHKDARKVELNLYSNASLFNLRLNIAAMFGVKWNEIDITKEKESDIIYPQSDNNKTLDNLDLYARQTLCINKVPLTPCYPEDLLINRNEMNPKLKTILLEAFEQFSDQGKMSPENYAAYFGQCCGYRCHLMNGIVVEFFRQVDNDRDGYLSQEDFLRYYLSLCQSKPDWVRNHLKGLGYRDDFKKVNGLGQIKVDEKSLLRYLISINNDYFQLLYSLLEDDDAQIAQKAWSLISQLPTNIQILEEIVVLKGVKSSPSTQIAPNWYALLNPKSKYKLLYSLLAVESLIKNTFKEKKNNERENFIMDFFWPQNEQLSKYWKDWPTGFLVHGGPTHLINIFIELINSDSEKLDKIERSIICSILSIVVSYLPVVAIYLPPDSNRIPSLKRILNQLVSFYDEYIKGKRILATGKEYLKINERRSTKVQIDVTKEEQVIDIFLKTNLKSFIRGIVGLNFHLLKMPEKSFEADDLMISKSSITILRTLILYGESIEK